MIRFSDISCLKKGDIYHLLEKSYSGLIESVEIKLGKRFLSKWRRDDQVSFSNPKVGDCIFVSAINQTAIGFIAFDPRQFPQLGIIGQNVILPEYRKKGYGKAQLTHLLDYFKSQKVGLARVTTGDLDFFLPAKRMYLGAGFIEAGRKVNNEFGFDEIIFEKHLF